MSNFLRVNLSFNSKKGLDVSFKSEVTKTHLQWLLEQPSSTLSTEKWVGVMITWDEDLRHMSTSRGRQSVRSNSLSVWRCWDPKIQLDLPQELLWHCWRRFLVFAISVETTDIATLWIMVIVVINKCLEVANLDVLFAAFTLYKGVQLEHHASMIHRGTVTIYIHEPRVTF